MTKDQGEETATALRHKSPPDPDVQLLKGELTPGEWAFSSITGYRGFILQAGSGSVQIGSNKVSFTAPCLIWVQAREDLKLRVNAGSRGVTLYVSELGFVRSLDKGANVYAMRSALTSELLHIKLDALQARRVTQNLETLLEEYSNDWPGMEEAVRHHLSLFLIAAWRLSGPIMRETQTLPRKIMHRFMHAVEINLKHQWTIARYAQEVGVTAERLNFMVRKVSGHSPQAIIHARITEEAVALLEGSSLRIADIAEVLGFHDPAYFSRFFKRQTGQSPNEYRNNLNLRTLGDASFAAWP